ncbi:MAG TPA: hypothetical protein VGK93_10425 [Candidatus Eisenbacteria bacterium]|jgi:hypothetical protein
MIRDPEHRGRFAAEFYASVAPRLFDDIVESGVLPAASPDAVRRAHAEWECFALYACVRGLVAAGGFNQETSRALDAMHEAALADEARSRPPGEAPNPVPSEGPGPAPGETADPPPAEESTKRRVLISERYAEYGSIGQEGGATGAATVGLRLGKAAAQHMAAPAAATEELATLVASLHEALVEGVAEAVRQAE